MTVDYLFSRFTVMDYIADYIGFTDHSEEPSMMVAPTGMVPGCAGTSPVMAQPIHSQAAPPYYTGSSYYVLKTYYLRASTKE